MFGPGPLKSSDVWRLDRMERQLAGLMAPIVCGAFGMVRAADGRPIIYSLAGFDSGAGNLAVCGAPLAPTTPSCDPCDVTDDDVVRVEDVTDVAFAKCLFVVRRTAGCSGSGSGSASGSGSSAAHVGVEIDLGGLTGEIKSGAIGVKFCPDTCEVVAWYRYLCFDRGLLMGYRDEEEPDCP